MRSPSARDGHKKTGRRRGRLYDIIKDSVTVFDAHYKLEKDLGRLGNDTPGMAQGIRLIRAVLAEVQQLGEDFIVASRDQEVVYFRDVWPVFYGRLLLCIRMYVFLEASVTAPADQVEVGVRRDPKKIALFFHKHRGFWCEYRVGGADEQFTRAYSRGCCWIHARLSSTPSG